MESKKKTNQFIDMENELVVAREVGVWSDKILEGYFEIQTPSY